MQFMAGKFLSALCIFVVAFFTDVLDGYLARANGWVTDIGKLLDPLADKLMTLAVLVCIYLGKQKPVYLILFLLMVVKELLMVAGGVYMAKRNVVAVALWPGKIATGLFAAGLALALLSFLSLKVEPWDLVVLSVATAASYFALYFYAAKQLPKAFGKRTGGERGAEGNGER
jgi:cardiolipin synthase (CMP-forming)